MVGTNFKGRVAVAFLFVLSYVLLFFLSFATQGAEKIPFLPLPSWISPAYFVFPIAGFFFIYWLVPWASQYFSSGLPKSVYFPAFLVLFSLVSYYTVISYYYQPVANQIVPQGGAFAICFDDWHCQQLNAELQKTATGPIFTPNFVQEFRTSPFIYFVLAGILGWASAMIVSKFREDKIL